AKCVIYAERAGEVVYANVTGQGSQDIIIEPGTLVRENQVIIRLPDPKNMQVKARVNETRISRIRVGMPAEIRLDAFPETALKGEVTSVSEYPAPTMWFRGDVKEYEILVRIETPMQGLKPGLTAQVHIRVEELNDVLQLPIQAVFEHQGRYYCVVRNGRTWEAREVQLGPSNDQSVVVCDLVELPVPVVFQFAGRAFVLQRTETGWESQQAVILSEAGRQATVRVPGASLPVMAPSVFEYQGKPVRLVFDGQQWGVRPVSSQPSEDAAVEDEQMLPIQAVFLLEEQHYVLESDPAVWHTLRAVEASTASGRQSWTARQVQVGSDSRQPGQAGVGLRTGEEVVLNAAVYRDKVSLPDLPAQSASTRGKPDRPKVKGKSSEAPKQNPTEMFRKLDRNHDERLSREELPEPLRPHFTALDMDEDGSVSLAEWLRGRAILRSKQEPKSPPGPEK
ncbi:MAG TPA: HlyD family efflux transporter periplasmic adaptor subunit, partial [Thermoguttaceae bacterium]|nr:HlyD family efflux transporter periplasmic adaptor subunit [Thermoguttaceae bacterium]